MRIEQEALTDYTQTGKKMYSVVEKYHTDLRDCVLYIGSIPVSLSELSIEQFFDIVKNIPYEQDEEPIEVIARPNIIIDQGVKDCKKASILIASHLSCNRVPYRFIACSEKPDREVHHVFTQGYIMHNWKNLDATYKKYYPFEPKTLTYAEVLEP